MYDSYTKEMAELDKEWREARANGDAKKMDEIQQKMDQATEQTVRYYDNRIRMSTRKW